MKKSDSEITENLEPFDATGCAHCRRHREGGPKDGPPVCAGTGGGPSGDGAGASAADARSGSPGKGGGLDLPRRMESYLHRESIPMSCVSVRFAREPVKFSV